MECDVMEKGNHSIAIVEHYVTFQRLLMRVCKEKLKANVVRNSANTIYCKASKLNNRALED